jgi:enoyl-CoA hydratase
MAKYLILTGKTSDAAEALRIGLVEEVVAPEALMPTCENIAHQILDKSPTTVRMAKALVNLSAKTDLTTGLIMEGYFSSDAFVLPDRVEGMSAFLERRKAKFQDQP